MTFHAGVSSFFGAYAKAGRHDFCDLTSGEIRTALLEERLGALMHVIRA